MPLELKESPLPEEQEWATTTGCTPPRYFKFNLRQFGNEAILKQLGKWLKAERDRLSLKAPKGGHPSSKRKSFRAVEALDVWRDPAHAAAAQNDYDPSGGEARTAARAAKKLRAEWQEKR